jgi:hypothetical protein
MLRYRFQGIFKIGLTLWAAKVGKQNNLRSFFAQQLNGREAFPDPGIIRNPNFPVNLFGRNIKIDPHEHTPTFYVKVANG